MLRGFVCTCWDCCFVSGSMGLLGVIFSVLVVIHIAYAFYSVNHNITLVELH